MVKAGLDINRRHFVKTGAFAILTAPFSVAWARDIAGLSAAFTDDGDYILDAEQREVLADLVDVIIPPSETPGARDAGVVDFIDLMLSRWLTASEARMFLDGLKGFISDTQDRYGRPFAALSDRDKLEYLYALQATAAERHEPAIIPFIKLIKGFTIYGYYTSEIGADEELDLNVMSGYYELCSAREPDRRAAALDNGHSSSFRVFAP